MSLAIGPIVLDSPVLLAPMSGVTDLPFRRLAKRFGAGLVVSEMIAGAAMVRAHRQTLKMATGCGEEFPLAVQLVGCEPQVMAEAARMNEDRGAAIIDINMGCPVRKVVKGEAGAALMRDERLAAAILDAVVKAVHLPVTLKMRLGWDDGQRNAPRLARIAEETGVRMVTVHGRTRSQLYSGQADWEAIGEVKQAVRIPVVGNGDVIDCDSAAGMLARSGADGVMIGRGAYGRPWLPGQVAHFLKTGQKRPDPSLQERFEVLLEHFEAMLEHYGEVTGCRLARKHIAWYSKGLPASAEFRARINGTDDAATARRLIRDYHAPLLDRTAVAA